MAPTARAEKDLSQEAAHFSGVGVKRRGRVILQDVTFGIRSGQVHALLGHNGAGKTTLIRSLVGLIPIATGQVTVNSTPAVVLAASRFPRELPVHRLIEYRCRQLGLPGGASDEWTYRLGVEEFQRQTCGSLSTGMNQRLAILLALTAGSRLIVLDEPTAGLDPNGVQQLSSVIKDLQSTGITFLICSHDLMHVELICETVTCLRNGRVTAHGDVEHVSGLVPSSQQVYRTTNDDVAATALRQLGYDCEVTPRGVKVHATLSVPEVVHAVPSQVSIIEVSVTDSLFTRLYRAFGSVEGAADAPLRTPLRTAS